MAFRDNASFGKRQEYVVIAELLKRGFDVYMTLVDDQGIDCIIRVNAKKHLDIQIKARSKTAKQCFRFAAMSIEVRNNYYFIFYTEKNNTFWIMPSKTVEKLAYQNKHGKNTGKFTIDLSSDKNFSKAKLFEKYKNDSGFNILGRY